MNTYLVNPDAVYHRINCEGDIIRNAACSIHRKREYPESKVEQSKGAHGYYTLTSKNKDGVIKLSKMHRLVAQLFIPNTKGLRTVNHIDRDKSNNAASNLEWMTQRDNVKDAHDAGLVPYFSGLSNGKADPTSYLFIHKDGRTVIATPHFMKDTFGLDSASLSRHLHAKLNVLGNSVWTVGGWRAACLVDQRPKEIELDWDLIEFPPEDKGDFPFYVHPDFPMLRVNALGEVMQNGYCSLLGTKPEVLEKRYNQNRGVNGGLSLADNSKCTSKASRSALAHTVVAHLFVPGYADGSVVQHIDGDKTNNKATNLKWVTRQVVVQKEISKNPRPTGNEARRADRKTYHFVHEDGTEFEGSRIDFKAFCLSRGVKISDGPLSSTVSGKVDNRGTVPYSVKGWRIAHFI